MTEKVSEFTGAILIDKPAGFTSHDVVAKLRSILKQKRIGHTGTLDPFATGLLIACLGKATRLVQFLATEVKEYEAVVRFGFSTDTQDYTGKPNSPIVTSYGLKSVDWESVLAEFIGEQWQTPPMFSAKKIAGETLYKLARQGQEIAREPVKIVVYKLEKIVTGNELAFNADGTCDVAIKVKCSAGTYIRTLAHDLGAKLGFGAHLVELRRIAIGNFNILNALTLEQVSEIYKEDKANLPVITANDLMVHLPAVNLAEKQVEKVRNGHAQMVELAKEPSLNSWFRLLNSKNELVAMAQLIEEDGLRKLQPRILFMD
ncbi:MAG: tRNA pseudouridine(55) synthase TruB [Blastocatellia bacterium]|nr:tRNA pseudouridine(55) synthase TruB [Blastocatellia bacterium]MBL8195567.1 tRNA pseudouridine(55) synthase TruB [Blastocatellia bacterium]